MNIPHNFCNLAYWSYVGLRELVAQSENDSPDTVMEQVAQSLRDAGLPYINAADVDALIEKREKEAASKSPHASSLEGFNEGFKQEFDTRTEETEDSAAMRAANAGYDQR